MNRQVRVTIYERLDSEQPVFDEQAEVFDELRSDTDQLYLVTRPNDERIFVSVHDYE